MALDGVEFEQLYAEVTFYKKAFLQVLLFVFAVMCNQCSGKICDTLQHDNMTFCRIHSGFSCWVSRQLYEIQSQECLLKEIKSKKSKIDFICSFIFKYRILTKKFAQNMFQ